MGTLQTSGSTKHWAEELSPRHSHPSQNSSVPFLGVEIQVPPKAGPPDALHSPRSTQGGDVVGAPDPHFSNNQTAGHRTGKIPNVLSYVFALVLHGVIAPVMVLARTVLIFFIVAGMGYVLYLC